MTTEYRERFIPPSCHRALSAPVRSYCVTQKLIQTPPKDPQASVPPKRHQTGSGALHNPVSLVENQLGSKVEDYTSVYQSEYRAWKPDKQYPYKLTGCLKVAQGLVVAGSASNEGQTMRSSGQDVTKLVPQPSFESLTSYRLDYISHPVQARKCREPGESTRSKVTWGVNQQLLNESSKLKNWSPKTELHSQVKAKESGPPVDNTFLSTAHAAHKCHHTKRPLSTATEEKDKKLFPGTTTMKEDYKAWVTLRRLGDTPRSAEKPCNF
ncbi:stabilizer of axonemal microtubules 2 isoform X2 [Antennarius striatus]